MKEEEEEEEGKCTTVAAAMCCHTITAKSVWSARKKRPNIWFKTVCDWNQHVVTLGSSPLALCLGPPEEHFGDEFHPLIKLRD